MNLDQIKVWVTHVIASHDSGKPLGDCVGYDDVLLMLGRIATLEQESAANLQRALVAEKEVKQLHISLAGAVQHGIEGWNRYESANRMCINQQNEIARLSTQEVG